MVKVVLSEFIGSFYGLDQLPKDRKAQIALAGRSNVGKSTLLNKLVGRKKLAKVSSTPGKTRALNFFLINNSFYLVDLPGYGYAKVARSIKKSWGELMESYLIKSEDLIGLVLLLDCRREPTVEDLELMDWLSQRGLPVMLVMTKTDKLSRDKVNNKLKQLENQYGISAIPFSAVSGVGKNALLGAITNLANEYKTTRA